MNPIQIAVQSGQMTMNAANRHMRESYPHSDFREQPFKHITFSGVCRINKCWANNKFLVVLYEHKELGYQRLTINRTMVDKTGAWVAGITWDELQEIKSAVGFGDKYAVELYPADEDVVNVANMRHLVLLDEKPFYAWNEDDYRKKSRENGFIPEDEQE